MGELKIFVDQSCDAASSSLVAIGSIRFEGIFGLRASKLVRFLDCVHPNFQRNLKAHISSYHVVSLNKTKNVILRNEKAESEIEGSFFRISLLNTLILFEHPVGVKGYV